MPPVKGTIGKTNWSLGEISPRAFGRFDADKPIYKNGAAIIENWLTTQAGGVMYRPGTVFAGTIKDQTNKVRFEKFRYSVNQQYALEIGNTYMRFWANGGQVQNSGVAEEIVTPFLQADLNQLEMANNADVMYIVHPNYYPQKLIRTSATRFSISDVPFVRGPFLDTNIGNVTITPSSATGSTTLTATIPAWLTGTFYLPGDYVTQGGNTYSCILPHTAGVFATDLSNGDWVLRDFFQTGHVKSLWRIAAAVVKITGYTNATTLSGIVQPEPDGTAGDTGTTSATADWSEGAFSAVRGYPTAITFHGQRLIYGGTLNQPQTFFGSSVGAYDDFDVASSGDSDSWIYTIGSNLVNDIRWMSADTGIKFGTGGGTISANPQGTAGITPSSPPQVVIDTDYSVQHIEPERIGGYFFYMQGNSFNLRQLVFDLIQNRDKSEDMNLLADHILRDGGGVVQIMRQQSPCDRVWSIRADGQIAVFTRNVDQQVLAWCRVVPGYTAAGPGNVETGCILPQDNTDDVVWVVVNRVINGVQKRYVEYFSAELFNYDYEPVRVDASLTLNLPITITGISNASPGVISAPAHGLSNGQQIKIDQIKNFALNTYSGITNYGISALNSNIYKVANVTTNTFTLTTTDSTPVPINTTSMGTYIGGGFVWLMRTTFSGLDHLNGETVSVMADGALPAAQQTYLVTSGSISLQQPAAIVNIGLPYIGTLQFLPLGGDTQNISQTKIRKVYQVNARVWKSLGGQFGMSISQLKNITMPNQISSLPAYHSNPSYTGDIIDLPIESSASQVAIQPVFVQNVPLPFMILACVIRSEIFEDK